MAAAISQQAGQNVVVLNRDGAAGTLGFATLAAAAPDGHMLAFGPTTPIANAPYLVKGVRYNVEVLHLCLPGVRERLRHRGRAAIEVHVGAGIVRRRQGEPGPTDLWPCRSRHHPAPVDGEHRRSAAPQVRGGAVPRRCAAGSALLRGEVDFAAAGVSTIRPQPAIRPLAIFSDKRHPAYPDVPTVKELGVNDQRAARTQRLVRTARTARGRAQRARARVQRGREAGVAWRR